MNVTGEIFRSKLDFWIEKNLNVLFIGKHGVGKTATVEAAFQRNNLNYKYFSASTMDPWVDFIGVPKEKTTDGVPDSFKIVKDLARLDILYAQDWIQHNWKLNAEQSQDIVNKINKTKSGLSYLELVRPYDFALGKVEAIFFDEFNRSPKKVRNAVMELIQFKSINGVKFPNLKIIWAAINPDEDEVYDVEKLDPAQLDRFQVHWEMPYKPDADWFRSKYGERLADSAIQWWNELPDEEKLKVTPRRLQYAIDQYQNEGDVRDVLPVSSNASKLLSNLSHGPVLQKLEVFLKLNQTKEAAKFLANDNNYFSALKFITNNKTMMNFFLPLLPKEKIAALIHENESALKHVLNKSADVHVFLEVCKQIVETNSDIKLVKRIRRFLTENPSFATKFASELKEDSPLYSWECDDSSKDLKATLDLIEKLPQNSSSERLTVFYEIFDNLPRHLELNEAIKVLDHFNKFIASDSESFDEELKNKLHEAILHTKKFLDDETKYNFSHLAIYNFFKKFKKNEL
jgi:hypothetical protein